MIMNEEVLRRLMMVMVIGWDRERYILLHAAGRLYPAGMSTCL